MLVTILGLTFKEDVPDTATRGSSTSCVNCSRSASTVQIADPLADAAAVEHEYGLTLTELDALQPADAVILAVAHERYVEGGWPLIQRLLRERSGLVLDVKMKLDRSRKPAGIELWRPLTVGATMSDNTVLVTGAAGFIGFHVAQRLLAEGRAGGRPRQREQLL